MGIMLLAMVASVALAHQVSDVMTLQDENAVTCGAGKWKSDCQNCPNGKVKAANAPDVNTACAWCAAGKKAKADRSGCDDCAAGKSLVCTGTGKAAQCPADCTDCVAGKYATAAASSVCTACASGKISATVGATAESACTHCAPGKSRTDEQANQTCTDCSAGQFAGQQNTGCEGCAAGKFAATAGKAACDDCTIGSGSVANATTCAACAAGKVSTGGSECVACAAGKYTQNLDADKNGEISAGEMTSAMSTCTDCAAGKANEATGQTSCPVTCACSTEDKTTGDITKCNFGADAGMTNCIECHAYTGFHAAGAGTNDKRTKTSSAPCYHQCGEYACGNDCVNWHRRNTNAANTKGETQWTEPTATNYQTCP